MSYSRKPQSKHPSFFKPTLSLSFFIRKTLSAPKSLIEQCASPVRLRMQLLILNLQWQRKSAILLQRSLEKSNCLNPAPFWVWATLCNGNKQWLEVFPLGLPTDNEWKDIDMILILTHEQSFGIKLKVSAWFITMSQKRTTKIQSQLTPWSPSEAAIPTILLQSPRSSSKTTWSPFVLLEQVFVVSWHLFGYMSILGLPYVWQDCCSVSYPQQDWYLRLEINNGTSIRVVDKATYGSWIQRLEIDEGAMVLGTGTLHVRFVVMVIADVSQHYRSYVFVPNHMDSWVPLNFLANALT